ncbi:hypothetical protein MMC28_007471 [Mycoblastus sanguinarius]|nr:hypothetical protein [Mycoblastus sanguinarius]
MTPTSVIPILTIGKHRDIGQEVGRVLAPHGFSVNGILSMQTYSPTELALVLRVLEPRPQALLIGGGYSDAEAEQAEVAFNDYRKEVGVSDGKFVRVGPGKLSELGREGVGK